MLDIYTPLFYNDSRCFTNGTNSLTYAGILCPVKLEANYINQQR